MLIFVVVTTIAYSPAFGGAFVFDDHNLVGADWMKGSLWPIWLGRETLDYWPLTYSSLWLDERLWAGSPVGFHAVNVLLHAFAAWLLYRLLERLEVPGALLAGLLFAVHPVAVESVAWISERKNVLSGCLYLASLLAWVRYLDGARKAWAWSALALFVLGLLAKTSVVILPVVLLGIGFARNGRISRRDFANVLPFLGASVVFGMITIWYQTRYAIHGGARPRGMLERFGGAGWAVVSYVQKAFVPAGLAFVYPEWPVAPSSLLFIVPALLLLVLAGIGWRWLRTPSRSYVLGVAYVALAVLPVAGLLDMSIFQVTPVANHLQYLSLMGAAAVVAAALMTWARRASWSRGVIAVTGAALVLALGSLTHRRAMAFASDETLWQEAHRAAPGAFYAAWMHADLLGVAGREDEALAVLERTARSAPDEASRRRAEAFRHAHRGEFGAAATAAVAAHDLRPNLVHDTELGELLVRSGANAEGVAVLTSVVRTWPASPGARYWLGVGLVRSGKVDEALANLEEGLRLAPSDQRLQSAVALLKSGGRELPQRR